MFFINLKIHTVFMNHKSKVILVILAIAAIFAVSYMLTSCASKTYSYHMACPKNVY